MTPTNGKAAVLDYWWAHLLAVPASKQTWPYKRLRRVWCDQTWSGHPFYSSPTDATELHLVATLFENFVILPLSWVTELIVRSGLNLKPGDVQSVNWGYEVEGKGAGPVKYADVALHFNDGSDWVIVVEAKKPGGTFKPGDLDPATYLDLDSFEFAGERRALICLVDEADAAFAQSHVLPSPHPWAVFTWQQLERLA